MTVARDDIQLRTRRVRGPSARLRDRTPSEERLHDVLGPVATLDRHRLHVAARPDLAVNHDLVVHANDCSRSEQIERVGFEADADELIAKLCVDDP